jgi:SAM-dependent methyltransferase
MRSGYHGDLDMDAPRAAPGHLDPESGYDLAAAHYDAWSWQDLWRRHEFPVVLRQLETLSPAMESIVDVGCGTAHYLSLLAPSFARAAGIDLSDGMLSVAKTKHPSLKLAKASADRLPFEDGSFDAIVCCRVLTHVEDIRPAFREFARVLKPGGVAVVTNIDTDPRYGSTRLPTASGTVVVDTVRHPVGELRSTAAVNGLQAVYCAFLDVHGMITETIHRPEWNEDIVASIIAFKRNRPE